MRWHRHRSQASTGAPPAGASPCGQAHRLQLAVSWQRLPVLALVVGAATLFGHASRGSATPDDIGSHARASTGQVIFASRITGTGAGPGAGAHRTPPTTGKAMACSTSRSSIIPCSAGTNAAPGRTGLTQTFTIQNLNRLEQVSYFLSCARTGTVATCSAPPSVNVNANSSAQVVVTYSTGATNGTGTLSLTADDGMTPVTGVLTVTVSTPPPTPFHLVSVGLTCSPTLVRTLRQAGGLG